MAGFLRIPAIPQHDASRARGQLIDFIKERGLQVASFYTENESGASLQRPELFRLLDDCQPGDVLLIEQVDRLSRLTNDDWRKLRNDIEQRGVSIVALDLPTSWMLLDNSASGEFMGRMLSAINGMLLDMLAAVARKDYEDRRRRQDQGIAKAKALGRYAGRALDIGKRADIRAMLDKGHSYSEIQCVLETSRATIASVVKERAAQQAA
ncbi:recombinase family protein [Burkholderia catarinensis]|uniref:recombinase family protein n=1 Tax=Burkholderia catarinensis TaxID=1108140 RepID=UPI00092464DD|nr:recombinase family protein [Burkholderia catarinensis]